MCWELCRDIIMKNTDLFKPACACQFLITGNPVKSGVQIFVGAVLSNWRLRREISPGKNVAIKGDSRRFIRVCERKYVTNWNLPFITQTI